MEIGNRLDFEERIADLHERAVKGASDYGLVMCDVDHFKSHNDKYGHQNGDRVLRNIAAAIRECMRASDAAFRYGGEEILLFLNGQNFFSTMTEQMPSKSSWRRASRSLSRTGRCLK